MFVFVFFELLEGLFGGSLVWCHKSWGQGGGSQIYSWALWKFETSWKSESVNEFLSYNVRNSHLVLMASFICFNDSIRKLTLEYWIFYLIFTCTHNRSSLFQKIKIPIKSRKFEVLLNLKLSYFHKTWRDDYFRLRNIQISYWKWEELPKNLSMKDSWVGKIDFPVLTCHEFIE